MNTKLVDSLVQIIESLSSEEIALLQEKLSAIQKTPGVCGGHACVRNTRIPVWTLVSYHQQGADNTELLRNFPGLTLQDLNSAWAYYNRHQDEINQILASYQEDDV